MLNQRIENSDIYVPAEVTSAYPFPPYTFPGAMTFEAIVRADPAALNGILPQFLHPIEGFEDIMFVSFNRFAAPEKETRPYNEAVVTIPAILRAPGKKPMQGRYVVQILLGSIDAESAASPTMAGHILYGMPKREGIFTVSGDFESTTTIRVERHGQILIEACAEPTVKPATGQPINLPSFETGFFLKAIPSVNGDGWDVLQLAGLPLSRDRFDVHRRVKAKIEFAGNRIMLDTGRVIPIMEVLDAIAMTMDFDLGWKGVVYDYLAEAASDTSTRTAAA